MHTIPTIPNKRFFGDSFFFNVHAQIEINYLLWTNVTRFICFFRMYKFSSRVFLCFFFSSFSILYYGVEESRWRDRYLLLYARTHHPSNILQSYFYAQQFQWALFVFVSTDLPMYYFTYNILTTHLLHHFVVRIVSFIAIIDFCGIWIRWRKFSFENWMVFTWKVQL